VNATALASTISTQWDEEIVPQLTDYIRIPAKSPHFDPQWAASGHIERVIRLAEAWVKRQPVRGLTVEIVRLPGRTPLLYFNVPGAGDRTVLLYGHLDKQPEMSGWRDGFGPWDPLLEDGKLYGRGGADDGYAVFASLAAIGALQAQGIAHSRCAGMIETCEESGSYDLPAYLEALAPRLGRVDSSSARFRLRRLRTAVGNDIPLRGLAGGTLTVEVLTEARTQAMRSASPSSFALRARFSTGSEDATTGRVLPPQFHVPIPAERAGTGREGCDRVGRHRHSQVSVHPATRPMVADHAGGIAQPPGGSCVVGHRRGGTSPSPNAGNVCARRRRCNFTWRRPPTIDGWRHRRAQSACWRPICRWAPPCASTANPVPRAGMPQPQRCCARDRAGVDALLPKARGSDG
jgi:hypothetical protein